MNIKKTVPVLSLILLVLLLGCANPTVEQLPQPTPELAASASGKVARSLPTATPRATATATRTPKTATPTRTPRATRTPAPSGAAASDGTGWRSSTPEEQGMDSQTLAGLIDDVQRDKLNIHSVTVVRHGYSVLDAYFYPYQPGIKHELYSGTKSILSALVGIAIAQGRIPNVQATLGQLLPEMTFDDPRKADITIEQLLTMTSGLDWPEGVAPADDPTNQMQRTQDWGRYVLSRPLTGTSGQTWIYSNGGAHLLAVILRQVTGQRPLDYARANLFGPMGISDVAWLTDSQGISFGASGLRLTPHDMARFGYLFLNDGEWGGQSIIPADWVETSTADHLASTWGWDYGYLWWTILPDTYAAYGTGEQFIIVNPKADLVVVFTGGMLSEGEMASLKLLRTYIIPAVRSDEALAPNATAQARLQASIAAAGVAPAPVAVAAPGDTASAIVGKTYQLGDNVLGWKTLKLSAANGDEGQLTLGFTKSQVDLRVGLDGNYRLTEGLRALGTDFVDGPVAGRGTWQDEKTFALDLQPLGWADGYLVTLTFEGDQVSLSLDTRMKQMHLDVQGEQN